jgi:hypothetical protein
MNQGYKKTWFLLLCKPLFFQERTVLKWSLNMNVLAFAMSNVTRFVCETNAQCSKGTTAGRRPTKRRATKRRVYNIYQNVARQNVALPITSRDTTSRFKMSRDKNVTVPKCRVLALVSILASIAFFSFLFRISYNFASIFVRFCYFSRFLQFFICFMLLYFLYKRGRLF